MLFPYSLSCMNESPEAVRSLIVLCLGVIRRYYRFNEQTRTVDSGYPKPISMWSGAPENIKAVIMSEDGCKFFSPLN